MKLLHGFGELFADMPCAPEEQPTCPLVGCRNNRGTRRILMGARDRDRSPAFGRVIAFGRARKAPGARTAKWAGSQS